MVKKKKQTKRKVFSIAVQLFSDVYPFGSFLLNLSLKTNFDLWILKVFLTIS